jgi:D-beta-D-heptose 7-phosphate kinase/D-beta-D-heptose 1-phosphate adenosyltransferase
MNMHSGSSLLPQIPPNLLRDGFSRASVLVVGDLMLDRYILGDVTRISPEAPVPVLTVREQRTVAGGAANVALNVAGLRARVLVAGVIGNDISGERLKEVLAESDIDVEAVVTDSSRPTTCKTRIMCDNHQIVRMDEEFIEDLQSRFSELLLQKIDSVLEGQIDAVILSDYAKGVLTVELVQKVIAACTRKGVPVLVDPKRTNYSAYSGATCVTPNLKEFKNALTAMAIEPHDIPGGGNLLRERLKCGSLLVTQGAHGMTLVTPDHSYHFAALAEEVFDVSGAGDTVIATLATALAAGLNLTRAVQLANLAASAVVRRAGTAPIDWETLAELVAGPKGSSSDHSLPASVAK